MAVAEEEKEGTGWRGVEEKEKAEEGGGEEGEITWFIYTFSHTLLDTMN